MMNQVICTTIKYLMRLRVFVPSWQQQKYLATKAQRHKEEYISSFIRLAGATLFFFCFTFTSFSQVSLSTKSKKAIELYTEADNYRVRGQNQQAISLLNMAIEKDKNFAEAYYRLGLVYFSMKHYPTAIQNFEKGLSLTSDPKKQKVYWFDLGESYLNSGNYEKAISYLENFLKAEAQGTQKYQRARMMLESARFAVQNKEAASQFKQRPLSDTVNRFAMQYFPVLTADQQELIFTRRVRHDDNADEDLVVSRKDAKGKWLAPVSLSPNINSQWNEGTCTISADGRKLIFTSCIGREGFGSCDLFQSIKIGNEWTVPENLGANVNSTDWESQPSLSADGRTLYFVSDRRGGQGRRDIWVSKLNEDGNWMKAVNAGKPVNTQYDEISPFIHVNGKTLYYATNGLPGFGGYDLYFVEKNSEGQWSKPTNVGAPINNHQDQFSLFITADGKKGYYVHEEHVKEGYDASRIFEVDIPEESQIKFRSNYVKGTVRDKQTHENLSASIELININNNEVVSLVRSDSITGEYLMVLTQGDEYGLYVNKRGYVFQSLNFNYSEVNDFEPIILNIELEKIKEGSVSVLKNIFFDTDKYDLKEKSITELQKIKRFLNENPSTRIEISGHTDNTGSVVHNKQLSENRAQSVYAYLIGNGVDSKRLITKGYGSDKPIGSNETEDGRQLNRRIEFKVIR